MSRPNRRAAFRQAPVFTEIERSMRVLALVCREARTPARYAELLAVAVEAGLVSEREAQWIAAEGHLT